MPTVSGQYFLPSVYEATPGDTIRADQHNVPLRDLEQAQTDRLMRDGTAPMLGPLPMNDKQINQLAEPTGPKDAATKGYVDGAVSGLSNSLGTAAVVDHGTAPGEVPLNSDLGTAAVQDVEYFATAAQGTTADNALAKASNLFDLDDVPTARTNLGLGTVATVDHGKDPGEVPLNSDLGSMAVEDAADYTKTADLQQPYYEVFTASTTWTKPSGFAPDARVIVEAWGGGGGGSRHTNTTTGNTSSGGGGGGYNVEAFRYDDVPASVAVGVGAGGAGRTGSIGPGTAGGASSFGNLLTALGGGAGLSATNGGPAGDGGGAYGVPGIGSGVGGSGSQIVGGGDATNDFAGGGGGKGSGGGGAVYGGGGGGANAGSGGASIRGGSGGDGGATGDIPGGAGGGGIGSGNGGDGARGEVRVWIIG